MATSVPLSCAVGAGRGISDPHNAFLSQVHANFDGGLRRFFASRGIARDDIADLVQEVYLRLARQPDVGTIKCAQAFVFATAINLMRDCFRRRLARGVDRSLEADGIDIPAEGVDPERAADCMQQLSAVSRVVSSLKPATQRVFVGHRLKGQSYTTLANQMGVSVSMVEKHMMCAIAAIRPLSLA